MKISDSFVKFTLRKIINNFLSFKNMENKSLWRYFLFYFFVCYGLLDLNNWFQTSRFWANLYFDWSLLHPSWYYPPIDFRDFSKVFSFLDSLVKLMTRIFPHVNSQFQFFFFYILFVTCGFLYMSNSYSLFFFIDIFKWNFFNLVPS